MHRTLATLLLVVLISYTAPADATAQVDRFVGAWSLVDWRNTNADGETVFPYGENPAGQLIYTSTGRMAAHLMRPPEDPSEAPRQFIAYWGTYSVDVGAQAVTHHVQGADRPRWIGTDQVRPFTFEGEDRLVLSPGGQSRLTWVRVR